jgi:hypothetical protein
MEQRKNLLLFSAILFLVLMARAGQQTRQPQQTQPKMAPGSATAAVSTPDAPQFAFGGNAAEIPATFVQNLILLPVNLGQSAPSLFVLDTSAGLTSIAPARAKGLGFPANAGASIVLPGVIFQFRSLPVMTRDDLALEIGRPYQGTLGADILSRAVVAVDYGRQTVRVFSPSTYKYSGHGETFPLSLVDGLPVVRARMATPKGKQVEGDFGIDTALIAGIVVSQKFSEAHHVFPEKGKITKAYDPQLIGGENVSLFRLRYLKVAGSAAEDTIAELSSSKQAGNGDPKLAGLLGADFLRRFNIVFDYPHQRIIFDPNTHLHDYDEEDKSGIAVIAKGPNLKTFEVVHVMPGSPAASVGIRAGDVIAGIDDEAAADMSLESVRDLFQRIGYKYKVTIQRGDQTKEVTVATTRLL